LTAKKNYKKIFEQAKQFNVKNLILTDRKYFEIAKKYNFNKKIKIFNDFGDLDKIFKKKK
jgi:1-deoxy-D-xylulose 5-phosphate reductoisomerase